VRTSRLLSIGIPAISAGVAAVVIGTGTPAHAASPVHYVALGDSYSSGVGAGNTSGSCVQSPSAYAKLWAAANTPASFTFAACSGARTSDVIKSQLSALNAATTLVSLTIGGNDVGFSSIMKTCALDSTASCQSAVAAAEKYANTTLPGLLDTTLADIRSHAPAAKVVFLDYPDFYDLSVPVCVGLSKADHQALDAGITDLDGVIKVAAADNHDTFADVRSGFSGHELCDGFGWLHSVDLLDISESYHPTAGGQSGGYLPVLTAAAKAAGQ
jgi:lysophospholipase L1-like esterase